MGSLVSRVLAPILARLGSRTIVGIGGTLFLLNMLIPDPIPLVDEFLILVGTILLSRWAQMGAAAAADAKSSPGAWSSSASPRTAGEPKPVGRGSTHK